VSTPSQSALQAETEARLRFEMLLADVCAQFVNVAPSEVDSKIENAQRVICESLRVDHSSLWQVSEENPDLLVMTHVYRDPNLKPLPSRPSAKEYFPWSSNRILNKEMVCVPNTATLPPEATKDKESWEQYGIHSSLVFPLSIGGGSLIGVLAFDDMGANDWSEPLQRRLQILAHVFAQALERKHVGQKVRESEERFRLLADTAPVLIWMSGRDKLCTYFNKPWLDFTGRSIDSELGNGWAEGVHPEDLERCLDIYTQSFDRREKFRMEYRLRRHDGEYRWILDIGVPRFNEGGSFAGYIGIGVDVTERKLVEQERLLSENRFRQFFETMPEYCYMVSPNGEILDANFAACAALGHAKDKLLGKPLSAIYAPECVPKMRELFKKWRAEGQLRNEEMIVITKQGERRTVLLNVASVRDSDGNILHSTSVQVDITERKMAEERLRESEEQFRTLAEAIPQLCWMAHGDGHIFWYNQRWYTYTGTTPKQMEGWGWQLVHDPHTLPHVLEQWEASIATGEPFDMVFPLRAGDGVFHPFLTRVTPVQDSQGRVVRWFGTNTDITELQDKEEAIRASEERLRLAQQIAGIGSFEWNIQTGVSIWTPELEALYGLQPGGFPQTQAAFENLVHADDRADVIKLVDRQFKTGQPTEGEWRVVWPDGSVHWIAGRSQILMNEFRQPLRMIGVNMDITERKQMEGALSESEDKLRLLLDSTAEAIYGIDLEHRCTFCNPACLRTLGYEHLDEVLGKNMHDLIHHRRADGTLFPAEECPIHRVAQTGEGVHADDEVLWRANGTSFPAEYWSYPQRRGNEIVGAVVAFIDITERKLAEAALANVSRRLIEAQEQERTRIGRELHDDIGQRLSLLAVQLQQLQDNPLILPDVRSCMGDLQKQTSEIAADVQSLSHELHSAKLQYLGIAGAMRGFCQEFGEQQKVEVDFKTHDLPSALSPDISLCFFRVLQEALNNSAKHSGVRHFDVGLWGTSDEIHLTVSDSGIGFDREAAKESRGLGLISMEERLKLVNGTFSIESQPRSGTTVHARVPLSSGSDSMRATG
jgi:PAS domain S-box-containing protein